MTEQRKITPVQKFRATDGKEFDTEQEAEVHQADIDLAPVVDKFIGHLAENGGLYQSQKSRSMVRNIVFRYEAFKRG